MFKSNIDISPNSYFICLNLPPLHFQCRQTKSLRTGNLIAAFHPATQGLSAPLVALFPSSDSRSFLYGKKPQGQRRAAAQRSGAEVESEGGEGEERGEREEENGERQIQQSRGVDGG